MARMMTRIRACYGIAMVGAMGWLWLLLWLLLWLVPWDDYGWCHGMAIVAAMGKRSDNNSDGDDDSDGDDNDDGDNNSDSRAEWWWWG